jgi:hypothetical protein
VTAVNSRTAKEVDIAIHYFTISRSWLKFLNDEMENEAKRKPINLEMKTKKVQHENETEIKT